MEQQIKRPNIFEISNKELSQDAFITWLIQWANPKCAELDSVLHTCGRDFLQLVMGDAPEKSKIIDKIEAGRQWKNIDIWAEIYFKDGTKTLLIIEDKTFTNVRDNQLEDYKKHAEEFCSQNNFNLICTYFKIGSDPLNALVDIREKGFNVITRMQIRECLQSYRNVEHSILKDYIEYVDNIEAAHLSFETLSPKEWDGNAWIGFYQFVESKLEVISWNWVNNRSGGFWNLSLTPWNYWNSQIPIYAQIEEKKICFKIVFCEEQTGLNNSGTDLNAMQNFALEFLLDFAKEQDVKIIEKPYPYAQKGKYRTLAVIPLSNWYGSPEQMLDKEKVIENLSAIQSFYHRFMDKINKVSFETANIEIQFND